MFLFNNRFWVLTIKEINQILRNKELIFLLLFPPTIQLIIYGLVLSPDVQNLKVGIVDYANTSASRELVSAFTANQVFICEYYNTSEKNISQMVERGKITAGFVIPPDFSRRLSENLPANIQVFIDGVDANTAGIASGYINQIVSNYSSQIEPSRVLPLIEPKSVFLYNPGLKSSWFFIPGMLGVVLTLISSLVSSATVVREKDTGTLEQLMMTPAKSWEVLLAKVVPLLLLLMGDVILGLTVAHLLFQVPISGNLPLFLTVSMLYIFVGIGVGIMLATICRNQRQVVLISFFINLPLIELSGAISPIESMPSLFQNISLLNPLRHYVTISRGILLKGIGLEVFWPNIIFLGLFATILLISSIRRFRNQLR